MANTSTHNLRSKVRATNKDFKSKSTTPATNSSTATSARVSLAANKTASATLNKTKNLTVSGVNKRNSTNLIRAATTTTTAIEDRVQSLQSRFDQLELSFNQLQTENIDLRQIVTELQSEVAQLKNQQSNSSTTVTASESESGTSLSQQEINTNIVIRGVDIKADTTEPELRAIYGGIRAHLGVSDFTELDPVSVRTLSTNPGSNSTITRPILVQLSSVAAKTKLLQVRRFKKEIFQSDIGIANYTSRSPILISEQLTRSNQELLFRARSLRGQSNYKFVWSKNGQILARYRNNSKVIRITDTSHVNFLRAELNLQPLTEHGRHHASTSIQSPTNNL